MPIHYQRALCLKRFLISNHYYIHSTNLNEGNKSPEISRLNFDKRIAIRLEFRSERMGRISLFKSQFYKPVDKIRYRYLIHAKMFKTDII
jgi:hypothetical protein